jgi:hypothetical protein
MRGILMIEPLYHQTIAGNKTQTRRSGGLEEVNKNPDGWVTVGSLISYPNGQLNGNIEELTFETKEHIISGEVAGKVRATCKPRYKVGEVLYIKEPTSVRFVKETNDWEVIYKFGKTEIGWPTQSGKYVVPELHGLEHPLWGNKLFMPASRARAFIRITGIKCERLLDISDEDCIAEGIVKWMESKYWKDYIKPMPMCFSNWYTSPKDSFISLYKFASKVKEVPNLWVWAYTFKYLTDFQPITK